MGWLGMQTYAKDMFDSTRTQKTHQIRGLIDAIEFRSIRKYLLQNSYLSMKLKRRLRGLNGGWRGGLAHSSSSFMLSVLPVIGLADLIVHC